MMLPLSGRPRPPRHRKGRLESGWLRYGLRPPQSQPLSFLILFVAAFSSWLSRSSPPQDVEREAFHLLADAGLPQPDYVLNSGRGLQLVWLFAPVPSRAVWRWTPCQGRLLEVLAPLHADPLARDACRVFRICGTVNIESGRTVHMLWMSEACRAGKRRSFEELASAILPVERRELQQRRNARRNQVHRRVHEASSGLTMVTFARAVLADLEKLLQARWGGRLPPGHRNDWLYAAATAAAWVMPPAQLRSHMEGLAARVAGWGRNETSNRMSAVFDRADADAAQKTGQKARRYRLTAATYIHNLGITEAEMRGCDLRVLVNDAIRQERRIERQRQARRRKGRATREDYLTRGQERCAQALQLRQAGASWAEVARQLNFPSADAARMAAVRGKAQGEANKSATVNGGVACGMEEQPDPLPLSLSATPSLEQIPATEMLSDSAEPDERRINAATQLAGISLPGGGMGETGLSETHETWVRQPWLTSQRVSMPRDGCTSMSDDRRRWTGQASAPRKRSGALGEDLRQT